MVVNILVHVVIENAIKIMMITININVKMAIKLEVIYYIIRYKWHSDQNKSILIYL